MINLSDLTRTKSLPKVSKLSLEKHLFEIGYLAVHEIMILKKIGRLCFHHFNSIVRICQNLKGKSIDTMHMCNALDKTKSYLMLQCTNFFMDRNRKSVSATKRSNSINNTDRTDHSMATANLKKS